MQSNPGLTRILREVCGDRVLDDPTVMTRLKDHVGDPSLHERVGAVSGELILRDETQAEAATDVGIYWRYEKAIRSLESEIHSVPGATGAIYAIRRELYQTLPENTLIDDVLIPMRIVLGGKRAVFDPAAKAYDTVACCPNAEFGRKVRTLAGNYQLPVLEPRLLLPWRNPIWLQYLSHKLGRLAVPYALLMLFAASIVMAEVSPFYQLALVVQVVFYLLAGYGAVIELHARRQGGGAGTAVAAVRDVA